MPYSGMYPPEEGSYHPIAVARTMFIDHVDREVAQLMLDRLDARMRTSDAQMVAVQLRVLGGAMARVPVEATAFAHRHSRIMVNVATIFGSMADASSHTAWVEGLAADLRQGDDGAYVNFLSDEGEDRVRAAYPGDTWTRLVEVKRRYDPTNLFRSNQNIPPG